jgi:predicted dehydrogenase
MMNFTDQWQEVPDTQVYDNGFKTQWEHFIRHVVEDAPYRWTLPEGAKGVQLVEAALESWRERRWVDVQPLKI